MSNHQDGTLPWDGGDIVVTEDNVYASQLRHDAIKAVAARTATPEQIKLLQDCDRVMQEAMKTRRR